MKLTQAMSRWWLALPCVLVFAAMILLPGLGAFGLWEPQERQIYERFAPSTVAGATGVSSSAVPAPVPPADSCLRQAPAGAWARMLAARAPAWGRDTFADSDAGRQLPFALLGILCVLASAGIATRLATARAGMITALVLLSMPLLVLQSRQLNSEIGTAAGASLIIYGLLAIGSLERVVVGAMLPLGVVERHQPVRVLAATVDGAVGALAVVAGIAIGFTSGGALLGTLVPTAAFAVAGGFGIPAVVDAVRWCRNRATALAGWLMPRSAIGRSYQRYTSSSDSVAALLATALSGLALAALAYQVFSLRDASAIPPVADGSRILLGKALTARGCYSPALGGLWRPDDDLRYVFDSSLEQIAYGTFPWGVLAPIAFAFLLSGTTGQRRIGALALAWAGCAWIATEVFQRKVGFTLWAGFPALAIAIGGWLDCECTRTEPRSAAPHTAVLIGIYAAVAILVVGKDLQSFTVRLTSLLVGNDAIAYPAASRIAYLPTRLWVLGLGLWVALAIALASIYLRTPMTGVLRTPAKPGLSLAVKTPASVPTSAPQSKFASIFSRLARIGVLATILGTVAIAAFWAFGWQRALAIHLSSKAMFDRVRELSKPGDALIIMGEASDSARDYAPQAKPEITTSRERIVTALGLPTRTFAIAPQSELCQLHRELRGTPYFVLDDRNVRSLLLSNKLDGASDHNPLRTAITHVEPASIPKRPTSRIAWDHRIELLGWDIPTRVERGSKFTVTMYYKVLQPISGSWKVLFHFDGPLRFNGDHEPIGGRCQTGTWQPGDYIVDRYEVIAGNGSFAPGPYDVWTGFFTGSTPNFKNMPVEEAPADQRDGADRVKITKIQLY